MCQDQRSARHQTTESNTRHLNPKGCDENTHTHTTIGKRTASSTIDFMSHTGTKHTLACFRVPECRAVLPNWCVVPPSLAYTTDVRVHLHTTHYELYPFPTSPYPEKYITLSESVLGTVWTPLSTARLSSHYFTQYTFCRCNLSSSRCTPPTLGRTTKNTS